MDILIDFDCTAAPFLALYAETHFKFFRFFPSLLFKREPEVIFDMPKRVGPNRDIPILLILNDIDSYPVSVEEVTLSLSQNGQSQIVFSEKDCSSYLLNHPFDFQSQVYLFTLSHSKVEEGPFSINGKVSLVQKGKKKTILNDNLARSSKAALTAYKSNEELPGHNHCLYGDLHTHSQHSRSHVEFGPPLSIIDTMAHACGLSFVAITDHSYDLSCSMANYLKEDIQLQNWHCIREEIAKKQKSFKTSILLGEEISVINKRKKVVHLGAVGINTFIPGSQDGARRQKNKKDLTIPEATAEIKTQKGFSFAAHPGARSGFLQRLLLNRGTWSTSDLLDTVDAFQAVNSGFAPSWYRARKMWIEQLLSGHQLPIIAGTDAHGDFNRYRAVGTPFLSLYENESRYFAQSRTGIYCTNQSPTTIQQAIKEGKTFITNGPYLSINRTPKKQDSMVSNATQDIKTSQVVIISDSSPEWGSLFVLRVFRGYLESNKEVLLMLNNYEEINPYSIEETISFDGTRGPGYIRAEIVAKKKNGTETQAVTSPCYFG